MILYNVKYKHPFDELWKEGKSLQMKEIAGLIDRSTQSIWQMKKGGKKKLEFPEKAGKKSVIVILKEVK